MKQKWPIWIATMGGIGYLPAPGTFGSLPGVLFVFLIHSYFSHLKILLFPILIIAFLGGIRICRKAQEILKENDPGKIVFDETIGMAFSLLWLPWGWTTVVLSFIIFRTFDIAKPFGLRRLESIYPSNIGFGVMVDDLAAAILTNISVRIILLFI